MKRRKKYDVTDVKFDEIAHGEGVQSHRILKEPRPEDCVPRPIKALKFIGKLAWKGFVVLAVVAEFGEIGKSVRRGRKY